MWTKILGGALGLLGFGASRIAAKKQKRREKRDFRNPPVTYTPTMTPEQKSLADAMGQFGQKGVEENYPYQMEDIYKGYQPYRDQAENEFNQEMMPEFINQFTGANPDAARTTAFPLALGQLGGKFEANQAAQQMQYGQQRLGQQQGFNSMLAGQGLGHQQFQPLYKPKQQSMWPGMLGTAFGGGMTALGNKLSQG